MNPAWLVLPITAPLAGGLAAFAWPRLGFWFCLAATFTDVLAVIGGLAHLLAAGPLGYTVGGWPPPLGIGLRLDGPAGVMLLMTAVIAVAVTVYGRAYFAGRLEAGRPGAGRHHLQERYFWPLLLLLLAGLDAMFLAADLFNLYVTMEVVSLAAVVLAGLSGKPTAYQAAFRYLMVGLLGSLAYLLGVALVYRAVGVLQLDLLAAMAGGPGVRLALALISAGLVLKTALFPLHFWLPPAHANALAPVSALLSGLVIKGVFYLLFRLWFEVFHAMVSPAALTLMGGLGAAAVIWGGLAALRQPRLKMLIAYSTVAQVGYFFVAFPLVAGSHGGALWAPVAALVVGHGWAKAAMFMAAGAVYLHVGHDRVEELTRVRASLPVAVFAFAIAGVNIMGLPPSGGFLGKWWLITAALSQGRWWWGLLLVAGSLLAAAYVFRVVSRFFVAPRASDWPRRQPVAAMLQWPALVLALLSFFAGLAAPAAQEILQLTGGYPAVLTLLEVGR